MFPKAAAVTSHLLRIFITSQLWLCSMNLYIKAQTYGTAPNWNIFHLIRAEKGDQVADHSMT